MLSKWAGCQTCNLRTTTCNNPNMHSNFKLTMYNSLQDEKRSLVQEIARSRRPHWKSVLWWRSCSHEPWSTWKAPSRTWWTPSQCPDTRTSTSPVHSPSSHKHSTLNVSLERMLTCITYTQYKTSYELWQFGWHPFTDLWELEKLHNLRYWRTVRKCRQNYQTTINWSVNQSS